MDEKPAQDDEVQDGQAPDTAGTSDPEPEDDDQ